MDVSTKPHSIGISKENLKFILKVYFLWDEIETHLNGMISSLDVEAIWAISLACSAENQGVAESLILDLGRPLDFFDVLAVTRNTI